MKDLFDKEFLDKWYSNYHKLKAYTQQKECAIGEYSEELAQWISIQRRIRYMLPSGLKDLLARLNYNFEEESQSWESMYRQLAEFSITNGHICLPPDQKHEVLKDWLIRQVLAKRLLTESQFQKLDMLGVDWDMPISREHRWEQLYLKLEDFYKTFGHSRVPQGWEKDKQLALWVTVQRRMHTQGKLRQDREQKLQNLEFVWSIKDVFDTQWEGFYQQLVSFCKKHGHCRVPSRNHKLVSWMERQRIARKNKQLLPEREKQLDEIGFVWSYDKIKRKSWEEKFRQLLDFRKRHGHCLVGGGSKEYKSLGIWVASQRGLEAKGKLDPDKRKRLDQIGFVWKTDTKRELKAVYDMRWEGNLEKLKDYKRQYGTCQVSLKIDPALQRWTNWQRKLFYKGKLSPERVDKLNEIRFPWNIQEGYWLKMFEALVDFKSQFGHTKVPFRWQPNPPLAAWVYRTKLNRKALTTQKVELLNQIGFDWTWSRKNVVGWEAMYLRLKAFKEEYGHTRVPATWQKDVKLGKWVSRMRSEKEKLDPERYARLKALGFEWERRHSTFGQNKDFFKNQPLVVV